jgi:hypothetical protein
MKTKLIALAVLAAGTVAGIEGDLSQGTEFEVDASVAEGLLNDGKAKLAEQPPANKERSIKARVLADCAHGRANDVVELPIAVAKQAEKDGVVDTDRAAVAYAAKLPQNQKGEG